MILPTSRKSFSPKPRIVAAGVPIRTPEPINNLTVLSIAPLIAKAINAVFLDGSVTSLFNGQA